MRTLLLTLMAAVLCLGTAAGAEHHFLNVAITQLPPKWFGDVPLKQRNLFLRIVSERDNEMRLDYEHGWLHWSSDGEEQPSTCTFFVKLLPRNNYTPPLVFIHMAKAFAEGRTPVRDQTFVLEWKGDNRWQDVTANVIPKSIDLTMHFRPRRKENLVEVAYYKRVPREDGSRKTVVDYGDRTVDLVWDGEKFHTRPADSLKLSDDDV